MKGTHNGKDGVPISSVGDGVVNDIMFLGRFFSACFLHVLQTLLNAAEINLGKTLVE